MKNMQKYTLEGKEKFDTFFKNKSEMSDIEKKYMEKTVQYLKYIKWIPGIQMVGVGNSIAMNSGDKDSDIDLLIVSDEKRMWLVRIFCTFIFQILNVRKTPKKHAGRFCLSFFCTLKGLDFSDFSLEKDPYLYFWILSFKPLLNYNNSYKEFLNKNTSWADFSNFGNIIENNKQYIKYQTNFNQEKSRKVHLWPRIRILQDAINSISTKLLDTIDSLLKKLFLPKTLKHYEKIGKPYGIIINDDMLKFHNGDIRKEIASKF